MSARDPSQNEADFNHRYSLRDKEKSRATSDLKELDMVKS